MTISTTGVLRATCTFAAAASPVASGTVATNESAPSTGSRNETERDGPEEPELEIRKGGQRGREQRNQQDRSALDVEQPDDFCSTARHPKHQIATTSQHPFQRA